MNYLNSLLMLILLCCNVELTTAQNKIIFNDSTCKVVKNKFDSIKHYSSFVNLPDTLILKTFQVRTDSDKQESSKMPWIVALIIGLVTVIVNLLIANINRQSSESNINSQIENNKKLKVAQFKATLKTQNQQEDLNRLIETLTEFLSYSIIYTPDFIHDNDSSLDIVNSIYRSKLKIELLLNPEKEPLHSKLIMSINKIIEVIKLDAKDYKKEEMKVARDNCINVSRELIMILTSQINNIEI
jgi:hypothetical protein